MKHTETHKFKRGQKLHLDTIYPFSGIGDDVVGRWWEPDDGDCGDDLTITQDIEITITIRTPNAGGEGRAVARTSPPPCSQEHRP